MNHLKNFNHNLRICIAFVVTFIMVHEVDNIMHNSCDIVSIECKIKIRNLTTLIKVGLINKMPVFLIFPILEFYLISEGSTLDHGMQIFRSCIGWIRLLQNGKQINYLIDSLRTVFEQYLVTYSCY